MAKKPRHLLTWEDEIQKDRVTIEANRRTNGNVSAYIRSLINDDLNKDRTNISLSDIYNQTIDLKLTLNEIYTKINKNEIQK